MRREFATPAVILALLAGVLSGCAEDREPTAAPPTQTPWIIVVTATPDPDAVAEAQPSQTPWLVVATPTATTRAARTPKTSATPADAKTSATPSPTLRVTSGLTASVEPTAGPTQTETLQPPTPRPTKTPLPGAITYAAPDLLEPPDEQNVAWRSEILLVWSSVGQLAEDEYYHLHLDRPAVREGLEPYGDYVYVKDTSYLVPRSFLDPFHPPSVQGATPVFWWVRVVRKTGESETGKPFGVDIGVPSEKRSLIVEAKPGDA